ncbi:GDSL-type esterase/lipase family protein [Streptomyces sp. NPDC045431]|uniref:GDSL-type esterase/lipase family protein n=1 Tax=Streptomyces sp. NPDC045431 TaxID=3155613 RepID=UPI0033FCCD28
MRGVRGEYRRPLAVVLAATVLGCGGIFAAAVERTGTDGPVRHTDPPHQDARAATTAEKAAWIGTWSAAPVEPAPSHAQAAREPRSIRNVIHTSIGGTTARITLTNRYGGHRPLRVDAASLAVRAEGAAAVPGTLRRVTFAGGRPYVTIPPGADAVSDPVPLAVPYDGDLLVTLYVPAGAPTTRHPVARQTSYAADGDHTREVSGAAYTEAPAPTWHHLAAVDVVNPAARGAVLVLGDSLTDGVGSTRDANHRWPDLLADRLRSRGYGVVNQGIGGNRVLRDGRGPSALSRFERDALSRPGVRTVVICLGINDIIRPPHETDPRRITDGLTALTRQAHARGLRVVGSTLLPFGGHRRYTKELEAVRQQVNATIRTGGVFDAVVDFDRALRDPYAPTRLLPAYDSGDGLHPGDAGYRHMARTVDLAELTALAALAALADGGAPRQDL